ncbi:NADH dehydrogenase [Picochlorum sp. SENEW3]|nr:NADH dehydrogenase [Picochlorum sp. SENEW3]
MVSQALLRRQGQCFILQDTCLTFRRALGLTNKGMGLGEDFKVDSWSQEDCRRVDGMGWGLRQPSCSRGMASSSDGGLKEAMTYCQRLVKEKEYENYLWCSQLKPEYRAPIIALRALGIEIQAVQEHARTEMLLMMRYQWWKDSVRKAFEVTQSYEMSQPVMKAVSELVRQATISKYRVMRMIDAHETDALRTSPMVSMGELEDYAEGTCSQLLYMQLEACGLATAATEHAASHLGKAIGLSQVLRNAVVYLKKGKTYFPEDICKKYGVTPTEFLVNDSPSDVAFEVAKVAKAHLDAARTHEVIEPEAAPLFNQALSVELYLNALEKANFDIFSASMHRGGYLPVEYLIKLKWRMMREEW